MSMRRLSGSAWAALSGPGIHRGAAGNMGDKVLHCRIRLWLMVRRPSAASGNVCRVDEAAEPLVVGVIVARDDVSADHAGLLLVAGVVGAVEREVPQRGELGLDPV